MSHVKIIPSSPPVINSLESPYMHTAQTLLLWFLKVCTQFLIRKSQSLALVSKEPLPTKFGLFLSVWNEQIYIVCPLRQYETIFAY
jgi:hypothetical protein